MRDANISVELQSLWVYPCERFTVHTVLFPLLIWKKDQSNILDKNCASLTLGRWHMRNL